MSSLFSSCLNLLVDSFRVIFSIICLILFPLYRPENSMRLYSPVFTVNNYSGSNLTCTLPFPTASRSSDALSIFPTRI